ncbi:MAG: hypothetical protein WA633_28210 [Stellaceae bacterium]
MTVRVPDRIPGPEVEAAEQPARTGQAAPGVVQTTAPSPERAAVAGVAAVRLGPTATSLPAAAERAATAMGGPAPVQATTVREPAMAPPRPEAAAAAGNTLPPTMVATALPVGSSTAATARAGVAGVVVGATVLLQETAARVSVTVAAEVVAAIPRAARPGALAALGETASSSSPTHQQTPPQ